MLDFGGNVGTTAKNEQTLAGVLNDKVVKCSKPGGYLVARVGLTGVLGGRGRGLSAPSLLLPFVLKQLCHCVLQIITN